MTTRLRFALTIAVLVALIAAGCGGSTSTPKSKLIASADAICKPLNARRKEANKQVGAVTSAAALPKVARIAPGLATDEHSALAELRKLTAPTKLAGSWQKILAGMQELADNTAKLGEDASAGDLKSVEGVIHVDQQKERELIAVAANAGFAHCGRNV
jgi:asparagine N-glycosylation enzyme membrane subunit Stt3